MEKNTASYNQILTVVIYGWCDFYLSHFLPVGDFYLPYFFYLSFLCFACEQGFSIKTIKFII